MHIKNQGRVRENELYYQQTKQNEWILIDCILIVYSQILQVNSYIREFMLHVYV